MLTYSQNLKKNSTRGSGESAKQSLSAGAAENEIYKKSPVRGGFSGEETPRISIGSSIYKEDSNKKHRDFENEVMDAVDFDMYNDNKETVSKKINFNNEVHKKYSQYREKRALDLNDELESTDNTTMNDVNNYLQDDDEIVTEAEIKTKKKNTGNFDDENSVTWSWGPEDHVWKTAAGGGGGGGKKKKISLFEILQFHGVKPPEHRLVDALFANYNKHVRPTLDHTPTHVFFEISLFDILVMVSLQYQIF